MTIGFDVAAYIVTENPSSVSVSVSVQSGFPARDVVVTVQTVDGTATGGDHSLAMHVGGYCNHTYPFGHTLSFLHGWRCCSDYERHYHRWDCHIYTTIVT